MITSLFVNLRAIKRANLITLSGQKTMLGKETPPTTLGETGDKKQLGQEPGAGGKLGPLAPVSRICPWGDSKDIRTRVTADRREFRRSVQFAAGSRHWAGPARRTPLEKGRLAERRLQFIYLGRKHTMNICVGCNMRSILVHANATCILQVVP